MKVLVTGSRGFIGSRLVKELEEYLEFDIKLSPFQDITKSWLVEKFFEVNRPNVVVHLAANPSTSLAIWDPVQDAIINTIGTINVLESSVRNGVEHFIYASSAQIYKSSSLPIKEDSPCLPETPYAISKYAGELYVGHYCERGLAVTILRLFNVYGPGQSKGFVIPDLLERVMRANTGSIVEVYGSPDESRDYIYVDDVIKAIKLVIEKRDVACMGKVFNVGGGREVTTRELAELIAKETGKNVSFKYIPRSITRATRRMKADITKAKQLLGWEPKVSLEEGIRLTIKALKE